MLTVIMECRDQEPELAQTLAGLVCGAVEGLVSDVVVLDHGSSDGTARVAEAAGCRYHLTWNMADIVQAARGDWLLLLEPGARVLPGWIEEVAEYVAFNKVPARFSTSRGHRRSFFRRFVRRAPPLEQGLLLPKRQALSLARADTDLAGFARGQKPRKLMSQVIPSWVAREGRMHSLEAGQAHA
ncbi:glycosyltransferase [Rhizobium halophytocola]|uniref:Glycosyltransferase involved in cell wall biosynthesis n=1 Tax=Rhizobium halophytocola TaxID=735519 RepID=A0ABS4DXI2_9HYPH|nr:glycosyltransferase [Rhizobium halophytocola]MBP1850410.1 glycosyltransferase involved in cell wall biosynthesis [Rhizobium halophytocola]